MFSRFVTPKNGYRLVRSFSTTKSSNIKVTILGAAGGIGQPLTLLLKQSPLIDEIALYDVVNTAGVAVDVSHINSSPKVTSFNGKQSLPEALHQSDIVMLAAGRPREPGMDRDDLFKFNATIVEEMGIAIANICPLALVGLITNPLNSNMPVLCETMMKERKFDPRRVIGVTTLDEVRAAAFVGAASNTDPSILSIPVVGGHSGVTIVPLLSQCNPPQIIDRNLAKKITEDIREAGSKVVEAKAGGGSATMSMAWAAARFTLKLVKGLRGENSVVTSGFILSDICDTRYFSMPMLLGRPGIRVTYGLPLMNDLEEELLQVAIPQLKKDVEKGITFARKQKFERK